MQHNGKVCYLGDDDLLGAAKYLAGILTHFGIPYDRVDSPNTPPETFLEEPYSLYIFSDYPAARMSAAMFEVLKRNVAQGSGLVMLGGWESFYGRLGEYHQTPMTELLPVTMADADDRRNYPQPVLVVPAPGKENHPVLAGLPWNTPPGVGGFNAFQPKPDAEVLLEAVRFRVQFTSGEFGFQKQETVPLLVAGTYGDGKTAALATDVAPHWVGGWVDWGTPRITQDVPGSDFVDIGCDYAKFFRNLVQFLKKGGGLKQIL
ncbi:MAG: glutamine amidotransferase [Planctomycetia bacterium]|nr:glutamine amidotransferase [Planctomycetia bacterium]